MSENSIHLTLNDSTPLTDPQAKLADYRTHGEDQMIRILVCPGVKGCQHHPVLRRATEEFLVEYRKRQGALDQLEEDRPAIIEK